ncbi:MAG: hypothetical protein ACLSAF_13420 [Intestinimonas sp.]
MPGDAVWYAAHERTGGRGDRHAPVQTEAPVSTPEAAPEGSPAPTAEASPEVSSTPAPETSPEVSPTPAPEASPEVSPTPTPSTEVPMDEVLDELETVETPPAAVSSVENGFGHKILHLDCGRKYFTNRGVKPLPLGMGI